jgi:hypothetical protein
VVGDALENVRPEQGIERGLVDQADRRVEIIYPIGVNTSWSQINLHFSPVLSAQEIPMTARYFFVALAGRSRTGQRTIGRRDGAGSR